MTEANKTPADPIEVINQEHFEKLTTSSLLLKCFEVMKDATEFVAEGGVIQHQDDTDVSFYEAYWALKVLYARETGEDAREVIEKGIARLRASLLSDAVEEPVLNADSERAVLLDEAYFQQWDNVTLAAMAFNSTDEAYDVLTHTRNQHLDDNTAWNIATHIANSKAAMRALLLRMAGGSMGAFAELLNRPNGETLQ